MTIRDGGRCLREGLDEDSHKRDGRMLWRCALSAEILGVREWGGFVLN